MLINLLQVLYVSLLVVIPSSKLRSRIIAFATAVQAIFFITATVALPYMLNPENGNLRGKNWFEFCRLLYNLLHFFRLPESENRSFEELDIMFHRVSAGKLRDYAIKHMMTNLSVKFLFNEFIVLFSFYYTHFYFDFHFSFV